jgi:hypothetical protein
MIKGNRATNLSVKKKQIRVGASSTVYSLKQIQVLLSLITQEEGAFGIALQVVANDAWCLKPRSEQLLDDMPILL